MNLTPKLFSGFFYFFFVLFLRDSCLTYQKYEGFRDNIYFAMISTNNLSFAYDGEMTFNFPDIMVEGAEDLVILGESGIGKTTLLHLLGGLLAPQTGSIIINDTEITRLTTRAMDKFRGNQIGMIYQKAYFVKSLTVLENLLLIQYLAGKEKDKSKALSLLQDLGIKGKANEKTTALSQGQRQRASIAMAVLNDPTIILADEPTANLDDKNADLVVQLLKAQASNTHANLLVITHDHRIKSKFQNQFQL